MNKKSTGKIRKKTEQSSGRQEKEAEEERKNKENQTKSAAAEAYDLETPAAYSNLFLEIGTKQNSPAF